MTDLTGAKLLLLMNEYVHFYPGEPAHLADRISRSSGIPIREVELALATLHEMGFVAEREEWVCSKDPFFYRALGAADLNQERLQKIALSVGAKEDGQETREEFSQRHVQLPFD